MTVAADGARPYAGKGPSGDAPAVERTLAWLAPRLEGIDDDLSDAVRACVRAVDADDGTPVPELLARAAVDELDRVVDGAADRGAAVRLLAADAALTFAFEAAADLEADVPALADDVGLRGRIGARLAELTGEAAT